MRIEVTVKLVFDCEKNDLDEIRFDLEECLDETVARGSMFGSTEVGDNMDLRDWQVVEYKGSESQ